MNKQERKTKYNQLCAEGKITGLFLQPWWLDATSDWDVSFAVRKDRIVGAMPFAIKKKWGIKTISMPDHSHHLKLWMDKPPDITPHKWLTREKQIIWSIIDNLPSYGFFSMVFTSDSFDNWLPFHWKGFRQEMRYTFIIERADAAIIDEHINSSFKKKLRKASESLVIRRDVDRKSFYDVCSRTYDRQKIKTPYSYSSFETLDKAIEKHKAGMRLGAYTQEGKLIAVSSLVWDDQIAYYHLSGDEEEGREQAASLFLCREAIRIAFEERGLQTFDFCGSMIEPVTEIRRQFGAKSVPLLKIFKANYKWLDVVYILTR